MWARGGETEIACFYDISAKNEIKAIFTPQRIAFAPIRNPYWTGLLLTHVNGHFGAVNVMKRSCAAPISSRVTYPIGVHTIQASFSYRHEKVSGIV